jgi:hypothetical protein
VSWTGGPADRRTAAAGRPGGGAATGGFAGFVILVLALLGCQERLTAPAQCPELCPGGSQTVFDTVLDPLPGVDSSISGYIARGSGSALLVSSGLPASEDRAVYRFTSRPDSITVSGTPHAYTVDSVTLVFNLVARDTAVKGLRVIVSRVAPTVDTSTTFGDIESQLVDANLIDTVGVADSATTGSFRVVLRGSDVDRVALPVGGGGVLAVGLRIAANGGTGIRVGSVNGGNGASFTSYLTLPDLADTASARHQVVVRTIAFNTFVTQTPVLPDPNLLLIGGEPSSRALIRFSLPARLLDSAKVVRATLELTPVTTILGLPHDPALLQSRPVLADLGAKSPVLSDNFYLATDTLQTGTATTVPLELARTVQLWQANRSRPQAVFLSLAPEGASFTRPVFQSTRAADPAVRPRLRITYLLSFPFENP